MIPPFLLESRYAGAHLELIQHQVHDVTNRGLIDERCREKITAVFQELSHFFSEIPDDFTNDAFEKAIRSLKNRITALIKADDAHPKLQDLQELMERLVDTATSEDPPLPMSLCNEMGNLQQPIEPAICKAMHSLLFTAITNEVKEAIHTLSCSSVTARDAAYSEIQKNQEKHTALQKAIGERISRKEKELEQSRLRDLLETKYGVPWYLLENLPEETVDDLRSLTDKLDALWIAVEPLIPTDAICFYRTFTSLCVVKNPWYALRMFNLWTISQSENESIFAMRDNTPFIKKMIELFPENLESFLSMSNQRTEMSSDVTWFKNLIELHPEHIPLILWNAGKKTRTALKNNQNFFIALLKKTPKYASMIMKEASPSMKTVISHDLPLLISLIIDHPSYTKKILAIADQTIKNCISNDVGILTKILSAAPLDQIEGVLKATGNLPLRNSRLVLALAEKAPERKASLQPLLSHDLLKNPRFMKKWDPL